MRKFYRLGISMLLLLAAALPAAFAYNFQSGGIYYDITGTSPNTVAVTYATGSYNSYSGNVDIPSTVTYNGTTYIVTAIGNNAFRNCSGLTGVTISNTVTSIGGYAFNSCSQLTSVTIPSTVKSIGEYAFSNCSHLASVTISNGVETISTRAFSSCSFHTVTIPASVTSIGSSAFSSSSLDSLFFNATNCLTAASAFYNCSHLTYLHIGSNVQRIPASTFYYCKALHSIYIPSSVSTIESNPFSYCSGLDTIIVAGGNSVYTSGDHYNAIIHSATHTLVTGCKNTVIPNSVTQIGGSAFAGCTGLTGAYSIPSQITVVGASAYSGCTGLTSLTIGHNVDSIGNSAFNGCSAISSVSFNADSCRSMGKYDYDAVSVFTGCNGLSTLVIGNNVKTIPAYAFSGCSHLTGMLVIPDSVKTIGRYAFNGCNGLTSLSIGNSVTSIGNSAFYSCSGMVGTLTIPQTVKSIESSAFYNCLGFTSLVFNADSCTTGSFSGCGNVSSLTIGNNVKIIPNNAFSGLNHITGSVNLPNTVTNIGSYAFTNCSGITGVILIPNSVSTIGDYAFQNCSGLTSLTIGKAVSSIGICAFQNCSGLTSVAFNADSCVTTGSSYYPVFKDCSGSATLTIGVNVKTIPAYAFCSFTGLSGAVIIPDSVTSIGISAFQGCSNLSSLIIGKAVSSMGNKAFSYCTNLTSVTFNADSCTVGYYINHGEFVFSGCSHSTTLTIGNNVKSIPDYAFCDFTGLSGTVIIPDSVTSIGSSAFLRCTELSSLVIGKAVSSIGNAAFSNCTNLASVTFNADSCMSMGYSFSGCSHSASLTIGNNVKNIPNNAFCDFSGLSGTVIIPDSVTSIGFSAFQGCNGLSSLVIGKAVSSIGGYAFRNCTALSSIAFNADSCNSFPSDYRVFYGCTGPTTLTIGDNVKVIPANAFYGFTGLTGMINIPDSVKTIGQCAFYHTGVLSLVIGNAVSYIGGSAFDGCSGLTGEVIIPNSVKTIGSNAFSGCNGLSSLVIGKAVSSIGYKAFSNCTGLSSVMFNADFCSIPEGESLSNYRVFDGCTGPTTLTIGDNVKVIPSYFGYFTGLTGHLNIPDSVKKINAYAFQECSGLTSLTIGEGVDTIESNAFRNCSSLTGLLNIPNSVTNIGGNAFKSCSGIDSLIIGEGVVSIGADAFKNCGGLTSVIFNADSCSSVGQYSSDRVFNGCTSLSVLTIGKHVKNIPGLLFKGCSSLSTVYFNADSCTDASSAFSGTSLTLLFIGDNVKHIPSSIFSGCSGLTGTLTIPDSVIVIGDYVFRDCTGLDTLVLGHSVATIGNSAFYNCTGLVGELIIPNSVTEIGSSAFYGCSGFNTLIIGNSVTIIGSSAFNNCTGLSGTLTIPNSVTLIKGGAFRSCSSIDTLIIGKSVQSIEGGAFYDCSALTSIFSYNETPPTLTLGSNINSHPFGNVNRNTPVYVPCGSAQAYRNAWKYSSNNSTSYFNNIYQTLKPYFLTAVPEDTLKGAVQVTTQATCTEPAVIEATPNFFYVFDHWSDGNTDNPRTIEVIQDTNLVAYFREYNLNINYDTTRGHIVFLQMPTAENPQALIEVVPDNCYLFVSWSDYSQSGWYVGGTYDNPRTVQLTQDTTIAVNFNYAHPMSLTGSTKLCEGDSTVLKGVIYKDHYYSEIMPSEYFWVRQIPNGPDSYTNDTIGFADSIIVSTFGTYLVTGTDSSGCVVQKQRSVIVHSYPTIVFSGETDICTGDSTTITAGLYEFTEDFTNGIPVDWTITGNALEIYNLYSGWGNARNAILFPAYNLPENTVAELTLPNINLKQFDIPHLRFKKAYAGKKSCYYDYDHYEYNGYYYDYLWVCDTILNEELKVMLSTDEGISWTEIWNSGSYWNALTESAYYPTYTYYDPYSSNSHPSIDLSMFSDYENVKIKFVFTGGQGNNMWFDDVQVYSSGCQGTWFWSNDVSGASQIFDSTGTWGVTFANYIGSEYCFSTDSVTITVWQPDTVDITINSPENYYVINGETFCTSGDYTQTLQNIHGCDSVINLHLTLAPRDTVFISDTVCGGWHEIYWEESSYDTTYTVYFNGIFDETIYSIAGYGGWGEAIVYDDLYGSEYEGLIYGFHVSGEYYQNDSLWIQYDETRTLQAVSGCDSVVKKHHYVKFSDWYSLRDTACGSYVWQGDTITANPNNLNRWLYAESTNAQGCYSSVELRLTLLPAIEESVTITACDSYIWNGTTYTESGVYTYNTDTTLQETPACKLTTLNLTINPSVTELVEATACDSYTWNDSTYTTSGEYVQTFTAANGCDSTVTLQLIINESKHTDTTAESCGSYTWNETTYTTSGEYAQTFTAANGCDSTVTLQLTILPLPTPNITGVTTVCEGQTATLNATGGVSYLWEDGTTTNTYPATVSGLYTVTVTNAEGCSATVSTTVTVNPLPEVAITGNTAICPGGSTVLTATGADSYQWSNGSTNPSIPVNMFGQYSVIGTSAAGCFSTASVTVLVSQPPVITVSGNTDICAGESTTLTANGGVSYMWSNGSTADTLVATTAGNWQVIGYNADGCSNMASVTVNLWQPASSDLYITAFDSCYMWFGTPRCESGNYTYTLQTIHGCDSVITLHLTLEDAITTEFNATSCDSYTWNGATYTVSGNYTQSFTAFNGNDSIVTLHLTINNPVHTATTAESCGAYDWNDQTYTVSGDYTYEHLDANGCTQVDTLHLTIFNPVHTAITAGSCGSYVWNGQTYTVSGDYTYEHLDANGCTQVDTLHLTIFNPVHTAITAGSCGSYYWNGQTYTVSGDYTYEHLDANGCTQVDTLHLTVNDTKHVEFADSTCTAYTWNGQTYASSGDYTQTLTAANGCDSVVTLHLTIVPTITPAIAVTGSLTACDNGSATLSVLGNYGNFVWSTGALTPTITVSEAGYYWVTATDAFGCEGVSEMVQLGGSTQIDETPAICMVDVEDSHNLLIWEELSDPDVASYHIYRENNQANVFDPLAVIPAGSVNAFADSTADPSVRAWRYKITAADTCGGETPMSGYHKTVHLTINQGLGNSWNLIWTPYEGIEFASYKLYRGTANNNLQLIQTMPATLTSYTDNNPAGDALFYQIEVVMTEGCVQHTRDITHTGARSNIVYNQVPVMAEETVSACENYDWNGQTLTSSGDYTQTFVSELGYDSVVTLHLTIHHTPVFSISGNLEISQGQSTALSVPSNAGWSYLWNTGETASVIIVTPTETTGYSVTVTEGTCNASDSVTVTVNTGINGHEFGDLTVYPNPTNDIVNVQCTMNNVQAGTMEFHVFDAYGKLVGVVETRYTTSLQTAQIDLSHYASGVYFVKAVADGNVVAVRKVVKR